jgi:multiple sugar transport system substrate-binding protein
VWGRTGVRLVQGGRHLSRGLSSKEEGYMRRPQLIVALVVVVALAAALVVGAQARVATVAAKAPVSTFASPSGTITLNGFQSSPQEEARLAKVVKDFENKYPKIHVNYQSYNNYQATLLAKFASHKPPDVFYVQAEDFADWVRQGILQPLDSYAKASKFSSKPFIPSLLNTFKYKGHLYGYPKDWSSLGMEINTKLLAGNPVPKTWAQLTAVAKKIKVPNGKPICLQADWARLMAFVYQAGGNGEFANATSPGFRVATNYYIGLLKSGLAALNTDLGSSWCGEAFGKERAAIAFEGNWMFPAMVSYPNVKFITAPLPKGPKRYGNLAFTVSYSMAKESKNKPAAWTLLKYLVGRVGMQQWINLGLALPTRKDVHAVPGRGAFIRHPGSVHGWGNQVGFRHLWNDIANNELTAVIDGKESVNSMLQKIAAAAK